MRVDWSNPNLLSVLAALGSVFLILMIRYFVMAGGAYALFWKILPDRLRARRIQKDLPRKGHIKSEILYSIST
ncbi:MAG TPA: hypothetical protein PKK76_05125, partial [Leptospiraceae bacterium]|nr:hypothetical protein [Leptospiraceae bacterium]